MAPLIFVGLRGMGKIALLRRIEREAVSRDAVANTAEGTARESAVERNDHGR